MTDISNTDDVIDSRDVIARIEELTEMRDAWDDYNNGDNTIEIAPGPFGKEEADELAILEALAKQGENYADDWEHGETLIRYSYFTEYVQELLEDCGDIPKNIPHYIEIDWEATARNVMVDYTHIDFDGVTYLIR